MNGAPRRGCARLSDLFIVTGVFAAFAATPTVRTALPGFIALSLTLLAVWNRPLVFRIWACGMLGFGTGMFLAGVYHLQGFFLQPAETIGWGGGIVVGTLAAIVMFIGPLAMNSDASTD
ncbi:MAG: hypothetical protein ACTHOU_15180 [Aureliella sp.]